MGDKESGETNSEVPMVHAGKKFEAREGMSDYRVNVILEEGPSGRREGDYPSPPSRWIVAVAT